MERGTGNARRAPFPPRRGQGAGELSPGSGSANARVLRCGPKELRRGSRNSPPFAQVSQPVPALLPAVPDPAQAAGPAGPGVLEGRGEGRSGVRRAHDGEGRHEVTHSLGNNRADKLQGNAPLAGPRLRPLPSGRPRRAPGVGKRPPRVQKAFVTKKKKKKKNRSAVNSAGSHPVSSFPRLGLLPLWLPCPGPAEQ
jgi:hypothetical protein